MVDTAEHGTHPSLDGLLLYRLSRLLSVAGGMVTRLCEGRFGITRREWRVLATLVHHGELGSSQLAEQAQLDRARTSRAVGSLAAKGLIVRTPVAGDRRQVVVCMSETGNALYAQLFPMVAQINVQLLSALEPGGAEQLDGTLDRLQAKAESLAAGADLPKADRRRRGALKRSA